MEAEFLAVASACVAAFCTAFAGWTASKVTRRIDAVGEERGREKALEDSEREAMVVGLRSLLRAELLEAYRRYVDYGMQPSYSTLAHLEQVYSAYHALGGNGTGTALYRAVVEKVGETEKRLVDAERTK